MKKELILYNDLSLPSDGQYMQKTAITESYSGKNISYGLLNNLIERTAIALRTTFGLSEGDLIMVVSHKSIEDVVLFYAATTAGLAYVPADPKLGIDKFNYLVGKVEPKAMFDTRKREGAVLVEFHGDNLFFNGEPLEAYSDVTVTYQAADPETTAYIIYTSGSGGAPKGVQMPRRAPKLFAQHLDTYKYVNHETVYISVCPFYFDATIVDLYVVLPHFGQLILTPDIVFPADMLEPMEKYKVTDGFWVPSMFKIMLSKYSDIDERDLSSIKMFWFGGEYCPFPLWKALSEKLPGKKYLNVYGPTEITHSCVLHHFDDNYDFSEIQEIPLGTPSYGTKVYIVNEDGEEVAPGETGELYVESKTMMLGYYKDEERSRRSMVKLPSVSPHTLYKTGDLVLHTKKNEYFFRGRIDDLVKVGGVLISLNEIEKLVMASGMVAECVLADVTMPGATSNALVAFIRPHPGFQQQELVKYLRNKLEPTKIPRYFELSDEVFPITRNGKVNRKLLTEQLVQKQAQPAS